MRRKARSQLVHLAAVAAVFVLSVGTFSHGATLPAHDPFASLKISRVSGTAPVAAFALKALDGETVHSKDLAGKVILLNFWATWCGPCKGEMPSLARLQQQLDPERFRVVTVTADMHPQGIKQFLAQLGIGLPVLFDEDQEVSRMFMVRGLPTTVLIAQDGRPIGRAVGPRAWDSQDAVVVMQHILRGAK